MLEERTFYFSEMQDGEVWVGLPEAEDEAWQAEVYKRVKAILAREGVVAERVRRVGARADEFLKVRVRVRVGEEALAGESPIGSARKWDNEHAELDWPHGPGDHAPSDEALELRRLAEAHPEIKEAFRAVLKERFPELYLKHVDILNGTRRPGEVQDDVAEEGDEHGE